MAIKVRDFEVRLTRTKDERRQVRQLRYTVFVEEEGASATEEQKQLREEYDSYDRFADYLAVFHEGRVVGTYRIINRDAADKMGGFYTESEFNISKIKNSGANIAEMSRACVAPEYRENALVMRLLWVGLGEYIVRNKIGIVFGVASWPGTNPAMSAQAISYLYYNHLSPLRLRATVDPTKLVDGVNPKLTRMNILPQVFVDPAEAKRQMTPLVKGYLRINATFGRGVFIDKPFNSYDVFVMLQTKNMDSVYRKRFFGTDESFEGEDFELPTGFMQTLGKIITSPAKGAMRVVRSVFSFLLREDAADAEFIQDTERTEDEDKGDE
ncbi:MAG: GNAT family N-acetyltransferase [Alphaproteobacteria bacterium]|nr:GNAT family N-acetyltransferase [Alphaproteobacteria bacterium]